MKSVRAKERKFPNLLAVHSTVPIVCCVEGQGMSLHYYINLISHSHIC